MPSQTAQHPSVGERATRYRFSEQYTVAVEATKEGPIGQYRVGIHETIKVLDGIGPGTSKPNSRTIQTVYTERPAQVTKTESVAAAVRRFDAIRVFPESRTDSINLGSLERQTIWYEQRDDQPPLIALVSVNRRLSDEESLFVANQVFLPALANLLPERSIRIGDAWPITQLGMSALLGRSATRDTKLTGSFLRVDHTSDGPELIAVLDVKGRETKDGGGTAVNAQLQFRFSLVTDPSRGAIAETDSVCDARGAVVKLVMAEMLTTTASIGSRRSTLLRELVLERKPDPNGQLLEIPRPPPSSISPGYPAPTGIQRSDR